MNQKEQTFLKDLSNQTKVMVILKWLKMITIQKLMKAVIQRSIDLSKSKENEKWLKMITIQKLMKAVIQWRIDLS